MCLDEGTEGLPNVLCAVRRVVYQRSHLAYGRRHNSVRIPPAVFHTHTHTRTNDDKSVMTVNDKSKENTIGNSLRGKRKRRKKK